MLLAVVPGGEVLTTIDVKRGESVVLPHGVVLTFLKAKDAGTTAKLGLEAPRSVSIVRPDAKRQEPKVRL